jgi:hypothetical protein
MYFTGNSDPGINRCTLSENDATDGGGLYCNEQSALVVANTIIAFSTDGEAVACDGEATATMIHCDLYGNAGGDWVGCIEDQYDGSWEGNFSDDPCFCDRENDDYYLYNYSPCQWFGLVGALPVGCWDPQSVDGHSGNASLSNRLLIGPASPNPFSTSTRISYAIPVGAGARPVVLSICDASGRTICSFRDLRQSPGVHHITWDGIDRLGESVKSGVYFCHLSQGQERVGTPVLLIR